MSFKLRQQNIIKNKVFMNKASLKIILSTSVMSFILYYFFEASLFDQDLSALMRASYLIMYIISGALIYYSFLKLSGIKLKNYRI